jgi:uracil-DNA glycosylase family 4
MITRCSLCPGVNACLENDGPEKADILFIGESPSPRDKRIFSGKVGGELNQHYLPLAGLRRENVLFTQAIRCAPASNGGKLDPKKAGDMALLDACATHHLYPLIERLQPKLIVPLGAFALRALGLENSSLDLEHGIPVETGWGIPAFPMFHPGLGVYEPKKMLHIRTDWTRLRRYLAGNT